MGLGLHAVIILGMSAACAHACFWFAFLSAAFILPPPQ